MFNLMRHKGTEIKTSILFPIPYTGDIKERLELILSLGKDVDQLYILYMENKMVKKHLG